MSLLIIFLILAVISVCKAKEHKDIFHPLILYFVPFIIQYLIYLIIYKNTYQVSNTTLLIYTISIVIYIVSYLFFESFFKNSVKKQERKVIAVKTSNLKWIAIITIAALFIEIGMSIFTRGLDVTYRAMRYQVNYGTGMNFFAKYLPVLYNTYYISWISSLSERNKIKNEKYHVIVYSMLFFVIAFFSFSRTNLLMALCAFLYCILQNGNVTKLNIRIRIRRNILIIVAPIVLLYLFSWIADATNKTGATDFLSSDYYLWKYFGYPLITMDKYATANPGISAGVVSLGILGKILRNIGILQIGDLNVLPVTGQFNVYSYIGNVYLDFGSFFFIAHIIIAMVVAYIYVKNKVCCEKWKVMYAFYSYAIVISFYSYQYSLTLYVYILILLSLLKKESYSDSNG